MGSCKALFLKVQLNFFSHLKLMWHLMLIMALIILVIGLLYDIMYMLADVMDLLNEPIVFFIFISSRR
jgi:hypothetical protein